MEQLKQWFEEASVIKVFTCKTHNFILRKGFKITHYLEDDTYSILDTRFNDFYTNVSEADMRILIDNGFVKGTNIIMYNRNVERVKDYVGKIESMYVKKAKYKKLLSKNKPFYTKRIKNCNENIHKYHDMMQFYQAQVEQFEKQKQLIKLNFIIMSRTKRRGGTASPIKKYVQFSGSTGTFSYYDKEAKERVDLEELEIIVLDVRASVTGYNSTSKAQITSNLVAEIGSEKIKVVSWKEGKSVDIAEGLYKDIKDKVKAAGGKFTSNVICLCDVTGEGQEICNLQFQGSSLNGWINFVNSLDQNGEYDNVITIKRGALSKLDGKEFVAVTKKEETDLDAKLKKNPRAPRPIWFYVLDFETVELTEEESELAAEQDEVLQTYFEGATTSTTTNSSSDVDGGEDEEDAPTAPEDEDEDEKDDLPF